MKVHIQKLWGLRPFTTKALHSPMHIVKLLQTWLIETEVGVMICLGQEGLNSLSALCSLFLTFHPGTRSPVPIPWCPFYPSNEWRSVVRTQCCVSFQERGIQAYQYQHTRACRCLSFQVSMHDECSHKSPGSNLFLKIKNRQIKWSTTSVWIIMHPWFV